MKNKDYPTYTTRPILHMGKKWYEVHKHFLRCTWLVEIFETKDEAEKFIVLISREG